ncbi:hypothetical protein D9M72_295080 [compost metagenome]
MEGLDGQQARVLALRARVGLQADARVAGRFAQPGAQLRVELGVALQLVGGREGVDVGELGPGDGDHLAGRVELHGAAAQRDHAAVEREVLVREAADVAQHRRFALVGVEHRVREEGAGAAQVLGNQRRGAGGQLVEARHRGAGGHEQGPQGFDVGARGGFVQRDAQVLLQALAQVDAAGLRALDDRGRVVAGADRQRIEGGGVHRLAAHLRQALGEDGGEHGHALCDAREAVGAVVHGVHAGDHGRQHLRGADVRGGLLATDVLLARLQREAVGGLAVRVDAHADEAAGQRTLERVAAGQVGGVRAAVAQWHAEALRGAADDVGIELAGGDQQCERQQVGRDDEGGVALVCVARERAQVVHVAGGGRVLREHAEELAAHHQVRQRFRHGAHLDLDAQRRGARLDDLDGLRVAVTRHQEHVALALHAALGERHGLGGGRGLVEHRGVGDGHAREVAHHRLEVEQGFHAALRDLGLVGRVGGVPGGVLQDVAQDHARRVRAVVALADEALEHLVLRRQRLQLGQRVGLGDRRGQAHRPGAADGRGHDAVDELRARFRADHRQHARLVRRIDADVAGEEFFGVL